MLNSCHSTTGYEARFKKPQFAAIFYGPVQATDNASEYKSGYRKLKNFPDRYHDRLRLGEMDQEYPVQRHQEKSCRQQIRFLVENQGCSRCFGNDY